MSARRDTPRLKRRDDEVRECALQILLVLSRIENLDARFDALAMACDLFIRSGGTLRPER